MYIYKDLTFDATYPKELLSGYSTLPYYKFFCKETFVENIMVNSYTISTQEQRIRNLSHPTVGCYISVLWYSNLDANSKVLDLIGKNTHYICFLNPIFRLLYVKPTLALTEPEYRFVMLIRPITSPHYI